MHVAFVLSLSSIAVLFNFRCNLFLVLSLLLFDCFLFTIFLLIIYSMCPIWFLAWPLFLVLLYASYITFFYYHSFSVLLFESISIFINSFSTSIFYNFHVSFFLYLDVFFKIIDGFYSTFIRHLFDIKRSNNLDRFLLQVNQIVSTQTYVHVCMQPMISIDYSFMSNANQHFKAIWKVLIIEKMFFINCKERKGEFVKKFVKKIVNPSCANFSRIYCN